MDTNEASGDDRETNSYSASDKAIYDWGHKSDRDIWDLALRLSEVIPAETSYLVDQQRIKTLVTSIVEQCKKEPANHLASREAFCEKAKQRLSLLMRVLGEMHKITSQLQDASLVLSHVNANLENEHWIQISTEAIPLFTNKDTGEYPKFLGHPLGNSKLTADMEKANKSTLLRLSKGTLRYAQNRLCRIMVRGVIRRIVRHIALIILGFVVISLGTNAVTDTARGLFTPLQFALPISLLFALVIWLLDRLFLAPKLDKILSGMRQRHVMSDLLDLRDALLQCRLCRVFIVYAFDKSKNDVFEKHEATLIAISKLSWLPSSSAISGQEVSN